MKPGLVFAQPLEDALASGDAKEFKRCVAALGVRMAARIVGYALSDKTKPIDVLLGTSRHLFDPQVLAGVPGAEDFFWIILQDLTDSSSRITNERKLAVVQAMGPHLLGRDFEGLNPVGLGPDGVRYVASIISGLPDLFRWMEAALVFEDRPLVEAFARRLSATERYWLWRNIPVSDSMQQVDLLHAYVLPPDTEDQQQQVFLKMICLEDDQAEVMESLLRAWPSAAATFQIQPSATSRWDFWRGKTLRLLLEAGATLNRESWITIFRWDDPPVLVEQIHELSSSSGRLINWSLPNLAGHHFLEEVYLKLNDTDPEERFPILKELLALHLEPAPLLSHDWQDKLSGDEKELLAATAALLRAKRDELAAPQNLPPATVVGLDLI